MQAPITSLTQFQSFKNARQCWRSSPSLQSQKYSKRKV